MKAVTHANARAIFPERAPLVEAAIQRILLILLRKSRPARPGTSPSDLVSKGVRGENAPGVLKSV